MTFQCCHALKNKNKSGNSIISVQLFSKMAAAMRSARAILSSVKFANSTQILRPISSKWHHLASQQLNSSKSKQLANPQPLQVRILGLVEFRARWWSPRPTGYVF